MVWALILSLFLLFPFPAFADEVTSDDSSTVETVSNPSGDSGGDAGVDSGEAQSPSDVALEGGAPSVIYSDTGELLTTTEQPTALAAAQVMTSTPYSSVTSNAYSVVASQMLFKRGWLDDYVFWRAGQYSYCLAVGDLEFSSSFVGSDVDLYTFQLDTGYSGTYTLRHSVVDLNLSPSDYIVYSNLGHYPVIDSAYVHTYVLVFCSCVALCMYCLRSVWSFLLRMGVRVHDSQGR